VAAISKKLPEPEGPAGNAILAGTSALAGTRAATKAVTLGASRAKMPLVAGGSAVVGLLGTLAFLRHRNGRG
jgi:hypothetical protein